MVTMHAIEISGERYIKATDAAALTGYATDYIGQLSRSGKIAAERVGRVWYVKEGDIVGHKKGASRSNKRKTQESLRDQLSTNEGMIHHVLPEPKHAYVPEYRKRLLAAEIRYEEDHHPLAPQPARKREEHAVQIPRPVAVKPEPIELPVERMLEVEIEEKDEAPVELPAPRHEPKMHGSVTLVELQDEEEPVEAVEEAVAPAIAQKTLKIEPIKRKKGLVPYGRPSYALALPVARYLMPLLIILAFGVSLGGVFLEQKLVYERGKSIISRPYYEMSYGVRAVSAIKEAISW
jgi:hypothetical protein